MRALTLAVNVLPPSPEPTENLYAEGSLGMGFARIFRATRKSSVFCVDAGEIYDPQRRIPRRRLGRTLRA